MQPERGDVIFAVRFCGVFFHYGVYVGNGRVIHYNTESHTDMTPSHNAIIQTSLEYFANNDPVYIEPSDKKYSKENTARKAEELLGTGKGEYNLATNNCEHFSNLCRYNSKSSKQVWDAAWSITFDVLTNCYEIVKKVKSAWGVVSSEAFLTNPLAYFTMELFTSAAVSIVEYLIKKVLHNTAHNNLRRLLSDFKRVDSVVCRNVSFGYDLDTILKRCPHCGAPMPKGEGFNKCLFCNSLTKKENYKRKCPGCAADYYQGETQCSYCRTDLTTKQYDEPNVSDTDVSCPNSSCRITDEIKNNNRMVGVMAMNQMFNQTMYNQRLLQNSIAQTTPPPIVISSYPQYKVSWKGQTTNPMSIDDLQKMARLGEIQPTSTVYVFQKSGESGKPTTAKDIEQLAGCFQVN